MTDRMSIAVKPIGRKIRERRDFMSLLQGILTRLVSLQEQAESGEVAQRYFEVNGERKCSVKFFDKSEMYELEVYQQGENPQVYQFDNIDMVAIEIYDIISDTYIKGTAMWQYLFSSITSSGMYRSFYFSYNGIKMKF